MPATTRDRLEAWIGEKPLDFGVTAAGVGMAAVTISKVRKYVPSESASDEILQAVVGIGLVRYGPKLHRQLQNFGKGILLQLAGRKIYEWSAPQLPNQQPPTGTGLPLQRQSVVIDQPINQLPTF